MWSATVTTVAPAADPLSLEEAKAQARVDFGDDDALILAFISAARSHIEDVTGCRMITQTVVARASEWSDLASLPVAPVQSITSVVYTDTDGTTQTLSTDVYEARLHGLEPSIALKFGQVWPVIRQGSQIVVTAVVGYGEASAVPAAVKQAMRMLVTDMYDVRASAQDKAVQADVAANVHDLLVNHRRYAG
jgi:uncharacterized phiE125 gp8 family phage protein